MRPKTTFFCLYMERQVFQLFGIHVCFLSMMRTKWTSYWRAVDYEPIRIVRMCDAVCDMYVQSTYIYIYVSRWRRPHNRQPQSYELNKWITAAAISSVCSRKAENQNGGQSQRWTEKAKNDFFLSLSHYMALNAKWMIRLYLWVNKKKNIDFETDDIPKLYRMPIENVCLSIQ